MDVQSKKHRMTRWLWRLLIVRLLVTSCGRQATIKLISQHSQFVTRKKLILWFGIFAPLFLSTLDACAVNAPFWVQQAQYFVFGSISGNGKFITAINHQEACHKYDSKYPLNPSFMDRVYWGNYAWVCGDPIAFSYDWRVNWDTVGYVSPVCPEHARGIDYQTCLCNAPYITSVSNTGYICVQNNLIITLSGGSAVEPSNGSTIKTLPFIATVIDQNTGQPTANPVPVHISLKVDPISGGHDHGNSTRPRGGIAEVQTCTSDAECWSNQTVNGAVVFNFNPTDVSGTHTITATCDGCSNTATANVDVKVDGLEQIPNSVFYTLTETNGRVIGAVTGNHTDNHYLTPTAASVIRQIAISYSTEQQFKLPDPITKMRTVAPPLLHLNDASLKWGGLFDICAISNACPSLGVIAWDTPHSEHRRGTVVDIRANAADGSIPPANKLKFMKLLSSYKVTRVQI